MENYNKDQLYKRNVNLYLEANPNPNSMKFVANFMLIPEEGQSFDYGSVADAESSPLAKQLFEFDYVSRVFFMNNFITITKNDGIEWDEIREKLKTFIKNYLEADNPLFNEDAEEIETVVGDNEEVTKIKQILEDYVKPAVEQDGGAIIFDSFKDGIVKVQLQGSCSGCPSSTLTLKAGIENLLKSMMPEVQSVEAESV
jgi:Fe-S cluster biogenesis protein NfuA